MSVQTLVNKIAGLTQQNKKANNAIKVGTVDGKSISVDGRNYPYEVAVDVDVGDGDRVYVMFTDSKSRVVVVGR